MPRGEMPDHDGWTHIETIPSSLPPGYSIVWSDVSGQDGYYIVDPDGRWSAQAFGSVEDARGAVGVFDDKYLR